MARRPPYSWHKLRSLPLKPKATKPFAVNAASPNPPPSGELMPEFVASPFESAHPQMEFVSPPTADPNLDDDQGALRRYRCIININSTTVPVELDTNELCLLAAEESCTFAEADRDASWRKAMHEEMESIEDNRTWDLFVAAQKRSHWVMARESRE
ncbi:hypothetical protein E2562_006800 [Oryza meyeriana var. granulata]|uniref:Uncharacterized protein n=1 Tax=Oryza meyeriana var. granulata TaxID=110450 RepID=A0A6G1C6B6_9ORYZ|nr:hypothetical protein E2562_006800 [Oryza meyeriana var. granulata]